MFENVLPIGTIVLLKGSVTKVMVTGFKQISSKEKNIIRDYSGVIYPVGNLGSNSLLMFDHEDIQDIIFTGYKNSEFDEMIAALEKEAEGNLEFAKAIKSKIVSVEKE